jgi:hypothetical protein
MEARVSRGGEDIESVRKDFVKEFKEVSLMCEKKKPIH